MLIVLSGLPGVGKTTIARELARSLPAMYLRIDSIEEALRNGGVIVEGEGYAVAHAVAADKLRAGHTVVADCVNPWPHPAQGGAGTRSVARTCRRLGIALDPGWDRTEGARFSLLASGAAPSSS